MMKGVLNNNEKEYLFFDIASVLEILNDLREALFIQGVLHGIDEIADDDQDERNDQHGVLEDDLAGVIDSCCRDITALDTGEDQGDGDDTGSQSTADLVDERLDGKSDGIISLTQFPLTVFDRIGDEHQHQ